ncbi:MAG: A/G-specific adenine glycosylase [Armatimonadetes bacterium]|nr:A/G-specific adenine glycosylase [Armatimonadota bacterium]
MSEKKGEFAHALLAWYERNKRDLPWRRRQHDPYAVWVSEIMLQQTTVAAVIPFYDRWMARFPTVEVLAHAPLDDVLKHWAGLGYYARARNLHRGAQEVMAKYGGRVPSDPAQLLALPGIGRYTAGAILSIAFNQEAPILDANVIRVLSRVYAVTGDPKTSAATQAELWRLAEEAIPGGRAGDFNQAMMELGALVCTAAAPRCSSCPVESLCAAKALGEPTAYPQFQGVKTWLDVEDVSIVIRDGQRRVLLAQRPPEASLWGGLWELPRATRQEGETLPQCAARAACEAVGLAVGPVTPFGSIKHVVANRRITLHGFTADAPPDAAPVAVGCARFVWEPPDSLKHYALATPQVRLLEKLAQEAVQGRLDFG